MSEALLGPILSAVIAGVFTLIAKRIEFSHSGDDAQTLASPITSPVTQPTAGAINYGTVVKHIGILQFILNLVGFLMGIIMAATEASQETIILTVSLIGNIVGIAG